MYLARGVLNPASRDVQRDLSDAVHMHRTLMRVFPDHMGENPRKTLRVLYRVDEDRRRAELVLFVQSEERPDFSRLPSGYFASPADDLDLALAGDAMNPRLRSVSEERAAIAVGDRFVFRLRANTTKKIGTKSLPDGTKQNGRRVPVRGDEERLKWLTHREAKGGFRLGGVRIAELQPIGGRAREHQLTFGGCVFEGVLVVTAAAEFRLTLAEGIGPAKAFGFGLLSVQRLTA